MSFLEWNKATTQQIQAAASIGIEARQQFLSAIHSKKFGKITSRDKKLIYLEGLSKCNLIADEQIDNVNREIITRKLRKDDAEKLEKTGLPPFFSAFVTLPAVEMKKVMDIACAKHEQQLECGFHYEGRARTEQQIKELLDDGSNRQMFEHECIEDGYATRVYPCLGMTKKWFSSCQNVVDEYSDVRTRVNSKIALIYDSAVQAVRNMKEGQEKLFTETMTFISNAEGTKCLAFKKMRGCILKQLVNNCGVETAEAFNTTISVGYLRNERSDRLQMDFDTISFPLHPFCEYL